MDELWAGNVGLDAITSNQRINITLYINKNKHVFKKVHKKKKKKKKKKKYIVIFKISEIECPRCSWDAVSCIIYNMLINKEISNTSSLFSGM